ncbi:hypothetical protein M9H77_02207 [Catharanthus roseus]|uniref:Uncharacterized protein n=1 Tax=Catharanthus roseus TaxID=4058 RepID=A0ACC0C7W7_CATRO|nr:hypothetical protein M9H77_02207 [Catharanthus roseus]
MEASLMIVIKQKIGNFITASASKIIKRSCSVIFATIGIRILNSQLWEGRMSKLALYRETDLHLIKSLMGILKPLLLDSGNGVNAYGGNNHGNGDFTPKRHNGVGIEDKGRNMEKELGTILEELPISLSLIPPLMCYEVSFMKLKFFLGSYLPHVSIYGDLCAISFGRGLFLVVPYVSKYLSSHAFLEDLLLHSGSMFDPSFHDFGVLNNASIESTVVGIRLDGASFDMQHDKCLGKLVKNVDYVSSFLDTFVENYNDFVSLN